MPGLNLEIITPSKIVFSGDIKSITVPGALGSFQVLFNHVPLMSTFEIGEIKVVLPNNEAIHYATGGGTIEVLNNKVLVLADSLEKFDEIDVERASSAKERAKERLEHKTEKIDVARAEAALARAVNRLTFVEKYSKAEV